MSEIAQILTLKLFLKTNSRLFRQMSCVIESWNGVLLFNHIPTSTFFCVLLFPYVHLNFPT